MAYIIVSHVRLQVTEPRAQNQRVIKNPFLQNTPFTSPVELLRYAYTPIPTKPACVAYCIPDYTLCQLPENFCKKFRK